jgi:hypothetical protein
MEQALEQIADKEISNLNNLEDEQRIREKINTTLETTKDLYSKISTTELLENLNSQRQ